MMRLKKRQEGDESLSTQIPWATRKLRKSYKLIRETCFYEYSFPTAFLLILV